MNQTIAITLSTYNNEKHIQACLESILDQDYEHLVVIVADDGSTDHTPDILREMTVKFEKLHIISLPHGERGKARKASIDKAKEIGAEFLYFIDADMQLLEGFFISCLAYFHQDPTLGALVIPEIPYSDSTNFFTRVKIFERSLINQGSERLDQNSIEAARFWRLSEYEKSGELHEAQIAFEEIQPTLRYIKQGGSIKRATVTGVFHDEGYVTLGHILKKKEYYFEKMETTAQTEDSGILNMVKKWYLFRPVYYHPRNVIHYITHPLLTGGMVMMYTLLTFSAVKTVVYKWGIGTLSTRQSRSGK
ncbi:hypothetical protein Q73_16575 [Bacillus coahuilensis m2-6]|uniref:Glycosyltransferase 2-like domain-containing protein n=1 Tax=Bacillus coahuilensis p1.1.43 TaxID=1150625 RepID=A0A147KCQ1_9BACI|nr:glycosyltransferase family 2 protein [Bacillus coahuilensis]KUP03947.1 hypothetical protein Q73_16575 [Bacillus coahuilensis m2-6]KUP09429.1 hypothetical protein Q75_00460 [Bacillus coahuilensis p1.1.43]